MELTSPFAALSHGAGFALLVVAALVFAVGVLAFVITRTIAPVKPSSVKLARYEAGNPPHGRGRGWLAMQYYPYLLLFLTFEPIAALLLVLSLTVAGYAVNVFLLSLAFIAIYVPQLLVVVALSRDIDSWRLEG